MNVITVTYTAATPRGERSGARCDNTTTNSQMEKQHNQISASIVGLLTEPQMHLAISGEMNQLFDAPEQTEISVGRVILVRRAGDGIQPRVSIFNDKLEVFAATCEDCARYFRRVAKQLPDAFTDFRAVGWNSEHEWLDVDRPVGEWLGERFIAPGLPDGSPPVARAVAFVLPAANGGHNQYRFEPRGGTPNGLFAAVNLHRNHEGQVKLEDLEAALQQAGDEAKQATEKLLWTE